MTGRERCAATRAAVAARLAARDEGSQVWARIHDMARQMLVAMCCPDRDARSHSLPWRSFTDAERAAMGAHARQVVRDLSGAQWLR